MTRRFTLLSRRGFWGSLGDTSAPFFMSDAMRQRIRAIVRSAYLKATVGRLTRRQRKLLHEIFDPDRRKAVKIDAGE